MKKVPMRKCVVTMMKYPKKELTRIVLTPEKIVEIDDTGRKNGRGAYVHGSKEVILLAIKNRALDRALKVRVPDEIYEELLQRYSDQ